MKKRTEMTRKFFLFHLKADAVSPTTPMESNLLTYRDFIKCLMGIQQFSKTEKFLHLITVWEDDVFCISLYIERNTA